MTIIAPKRALQREMSSRNEHLISNLLRYAQLAVQEVGITFNQFSSWCSIFMAGVHASRKVYGYLKFGCNTLFLGCIWFLTKKSSGCACHALQTGRLLCNITEVYRSSSKHNKAYFIHFLPAVNDGELEATSVLTTCLTSLFHWPNIV